MLGKGDVETLGSPFLKNVMLVENLQANLISISQLCDDGSSVWFDKDQCYVADLQGKKVMSGMSSKIIAIVFRRLGHINFRDLLKLSKHECVKGLPKLSTPITPQHNGVVERKNRTLLEMGRVILTSAKIAKKFWAEAISTACYTANRVYLRPGTTSTPYELWKGRKPNIKHMRVFGSVYYIYRDRENLAKFDTRSDAGIFLGYSLTSRAYKVFNKRTCIVMESINVVVNDTDMSVGSCTDDDDDIIQAAPRQEEKDKVANIDDEYMQKKICFHLFLDRVLSKSRKTTHHLIYWGFK
ncbi:hypothetical protein L3X38_025517 [Prunus dulcis]|uniref:Integrase catalytic domain-containing protein n=1 Tax=Prunus dulcis TaxID=3755 RepID=A0AAD4W1V2_PRUDU|nr:hypothetical protein L3X38_025517 [Prunus dulcis]